MLFELKSVFQNEGEVKQVNYKLDIADIDIDGVFPFRTPIDVTATAKNRASLVSLTIRACFSYSRSCDRCSTDFTREMDMLFEHKLAQTLVDDGNDDYIETPDFKLELDDIVISDILLSLPQKNLCKDDCKGLCQICGKNLNEGDCSCDKREIDPRLEMLKQFMD
ncbi:MAG: YceD family protein [Ruminococcus sp.]